MYYARRNFLRQMQQCFQIHADRKNAILKGQKSLQSKIINPMKIQLSLE